MKSSNLGPHRTRVLVVEDNPVDVHMLNYAFEEQNTWPVETTVAQDGETAINLLRKASSSGVGKPDFIILDLNLPKRDGTEVLQTIRATRELRQVPVAVLSSSPRDVIHGKLSEAEVTANGYFTKPMDVDEFIALAEKLRLCYEMNCCAESKTRS
ncbi:MAG: response regulator [Acidobacteriaceae bacterium]|nr:response regulator [Acidobacteriaceae bacterium]